MKICTACREPKSLLDFYTDRRNLDGRQSRCKLCFNAALQQYHKTPRGRALRRRVMRKNYHNASPERRQKLIARAMLGVAIKRGYVQRRSCERCPAEKAQAHHPDYSKPLQVIWLCRDCHREEHRRVHV